MLDALKFVQGAVAKKDFVPSLTHFKIANGTITGFNGKLGLQSPIDVDLNVLPKALPLIKAIKSCKETVSMHVTGAGRLAIKSGTFKAFIDCTEEDFPDITPNGEMIPLPDGGLLKAITTLAPFIAIDASRPWARGILFNGQSAFATNNVSLIEHWLGFHFPVQVNIPHHTIKELMRIKQEPTALQISGNLLFFHFPDGRWLSSSLYDLGWPDLNKILSRDATPQALPDNFFEAVKELVPFADEFGRIFIKENIMMTHVDDGIGARFELSFALPEGCFHYTQLLLLEDIASVIDFSAFPAPCLFFGEKVRGALVGMRQ